MGSTTAVVLGVLAGATLLIGSSRQLLAELRKLLQDLAATAEDWRNLHKALKDKHSDDDGPEGKAA